MSAGQARHEHATAGIALADDGEILAAEIEHVQDVGAYPTPWPVGTSAAVGMMFPGPYRIPVATWATTSVFSNTPGRTAYRGPWAFESVAREVMLDIAARRMGIDPVELRRRNFLAAADLPYANGAGMPYDHMSPREVFEAALERLDYDAFRREQAAARAEGRYLGVGTCSYVEPTTTGMGFFGTEGATIRVEPSGKVNVYLAGGSTGNSLETTAVQLAADALGVDIDDVHTIQGDTAVTPFGARHRREPQRLDDRRCHRGDGLDAARADRRHRRPQARGRPRGHRAGRQPRQRARHARRRPVAGRGRHHRLLRPRVAAARRAARAGGQRPPRRPRRP